jgi:lysophospholipase L1-like esterase
MNVAIFGDSFTSAGTYPDELYRRLATNDVGPPAGLNKSNITFVGDKETVDGVAPAYTGYAGWTYTRYNGTNGGSAYLVTTAAPHGFGKDIADTTWTDDTAPDPLPHTWIVEYITANTVKISSSATQTLPATGDLKKGGDTITYISATAEERSPLWDDVDDEIDWTYWATRNISSGVLDVVYVLLSWNGINEANKTDFTDFLNDVRFFLNTLNAQIPATEVRLIGIQAPSNTGGLGASYTSNSVYGQYYGLLRTANNKNNALKDLANETIYSGFVEYIALSPQFDSDFNMPFTPTAVNTRNATTESRGTNGIHPSTDGYEQIADTLYREFVTRYLAP